MNLGYVAIHDGRAGDARELLAEAAAIFDRLDDGDAVAIGLAGLAAVAPAPDAAARLLGAAQARRSASAHVDAFEPELPETAAREARAALGADVFEPAFAEGAGLALEDALALVGASLGKPAQHRA